LCEGSRGFILYWKMERDSWVIYRSFYEAAKMLPIESKWHFRDLITTYMMDWEIIDCPDNIAVAMFMMAKPQKENIKDMIMKWRDNFRKNLDKVNKNHKTKTLSN